MQEENTYNRIKSLVMEELKQYFRPEFLNRLDEIIVFRQLTKPEVKEIADIMLRDVIARAAKKEITIDVTERCAPLSLSVSRCCRGFSAWFALFIQLPASDSDKASS